MTPEEARVVVDAVFAYMGENELAEPFLSPLLFDFTPSTASYARLAKHMLEKFRQLREDLLVAEDILHKADEVLKEAHEQIKEIRECLEQVDTFVLLEACAILHAETRREAH